MRPSAAELEETAFGIRQAVLEMCIKAGTGHLTSSLSCIDILVALYHGDILRVDPKRPDWAERDRFILSKGQASPALYAVLGGMGFFPSGDLDGFARENGRFGVHLQNDIPGVEITAGSLGHGLGVATGIALGARMNRDLYMTFALLGDGELYEGSVWESALFAAQNGLNNLVAIVDRNRLCVTDFTENIVRLEPIEAKWAAFGWDACRVDGHSMTALLNALGDVRSRPSAKPRAIIADTVKGFGIDGISNIPLWHGVAPRGPEADRCRNELARSRRHE